MRIHAENPAGLRFQCLPGCGLCCAGSPMVLPADAARATAAKLPVTRRPDGSLGLAMQGPACAVLDADRACAKYDARPFPCRAFPIQLHALDRLQADVHLGCPGIGEGEGDDLAALARRVADDAVRERALDLAAAERNARTLRDRLRAMGHPEPAREVAEAFAEFDPTDPDTLRGLYAAASDATLAADEIADAVEEGREAKGVSLARILAEVLAETPRRVPDHVDASLGWKPLDLAKADPAAALGLPADRRAPLARHAARLASRDLSWGHALHLVDAMGYAVSPAAAYARVLADSGAQLLLRAQLLPAEGEAVASFEWWYWTLPTAGAAL